MNRRKSEELVTITIDGKAVRLPKGISVAAAVLGYDRHGETCTHPVDGSPRAPHCLMGVCFECMMEINGEPNVQACLVPVEEGMVIKRQVRAAGAH